MDIEGGIENTVDDLGIGLVIALLTPVLCCLLPARYQWKSLSDKERKTYKNMENTDKKRYEKEKTELLANIEANPPATEETETKTVEKATPKKSGKSSKTPLKTLPYCLA